MKKQNYAKITEWKKENTDRIQILPKKKDHLPERIQLAIDQNLGKSRQDYIINAVKQRLDADGIPIIPDDLPQEKHNSLCIAK